MSQALSKNKIKLILDSGAFTAWTKRVKIDIDKYIDFALEHQSKLSHIANLDVIPGTFGQKVLSIQDIEQSATEGWDNYQYMLKKGVSKNKLMHIFHQGEDFKWLHKLIDSEAKYIGISPANDRTTAVRAEWLKKCMEIICDKNGDPLVKFHGYAATSLKLMMRFPWTSVDSASWQKYSVFKRVFIPGSIKNGEFDWRSQPFKIAALINKKTIQNYKIPSFFSNKNGKPTLYQSPFAFRLQPIEWQEKTKKAIDKCGFDFDKMYTDDGEIKAWNLFYFLRIQKEVKTTIALAGLNDTDILSLDKAILKAEPKTTAILFSYYYLLQNGGQTKAWEHYLQLLSK